MIKAGRKKDEEHVFLVEQRRGRGGGGREGEGGEGVGEEGREGGWEGG